MEYRAPVQDMAHMMRRVAGLDAAIGEGLHADLSAELVEQILEEAGKFAGDVIAPLNRVGDVKGPKLEAGIVTTSPGWKETYQAWTEAGWNALPGPDDYGGQNLPILLNAACIEMWNSASLSFGIAPLLTMGGIEALIMHASQDLKDRYLEKLVTGEWTATMNLTEPQAGSDLAALRTKAEPVGDGTYRIFGQKIYITYGEHDMTDNIVHLVLARLPDAPAGTKGISLFLVPKILPDGTRNDVFCNGMEHKLGLHGSPTCTMVYGDEGGAIGWLIGEENRGLACMFTMMNNARLGVGLQGVAVCERAYQQALHYARERRQGRAASWQGEGMAPIIAHPDVQRMLMTMKGLTQASRAICYMTAAALDRSHSLEDPHARRAAHERASLLTPIAKAFSTDNANEVASLGVQVHGGMGYVEETGAAQHLRDARILAIYEGTNGIQAIDLVTRKLPLSGGEAVRAEIARLRAVASRLTREGAAEYGDAAARIRDAVESLDRATSYLLKALAGNAQQDALAGATPYLRLFGITEGAAALAEAALETPEDDAHRIARVALARFFAENIVSLAPGLADIVTHGAGFTEKAELALAG
ncbi:MAG: acyl-CoA dehydrogenase [Salinarimonas sp.]